MIHDAYTREYDAHEESRNRMAAIDKIINTASRFGLQIEFHVRDTDVTTNLFLNGKKFGQFRKLETALKWAEKWQK